jgi:NAD(P)-dependent dehydrogenase (short-subunit alcohol dehydrogenase family)
VVGGDLAGKTAFVTGGCSGIGRAVVDRFLDEGMSVGVLDADADGVRSLERFCGRHPDVESSPDGAEVAAPDERSVVARQGDVREYDAVAEAVADTVEAFGGLDVLVGNAGIHDDGVRLSDLSPEELTGSFTELFGVNVLGYLTAARAALEPLRAGDGGCMLFTASYASYYPGTGGALYPPAKHAVLGVVRQLAYELAPTIRVNGVAPNYVPTNLQGVAGLDQGDTLDEATGAGDRDLADRYLLPIQPPEAYAGYYAFLASERDAAASTGIVIDADCGSIVSQ